VRQVVGHPPSAGRLYVCDNEQPLDADIARIAVDIAAGGLIPQAVDEVARGLK